MRRCDSRRWRRVLQVLSLALGGAYDARIVSIANPSREKERFVITRPLIAQHRSTASPSSTGRPGPKDAPTILLLHGLPSSSRMFEPLFTRLSDRYHLVAPDYPGFGHSDWPDPKEFAYTFDHIAEIMNRFTEALGLSRYTLIHAGTMAALWVFAWPWPIRTGLRLSLSRTPWRTMKASG